MTRLSFTTASELAAHVDAYFDYAKHSELPAEKSVKEDQEQSSLSKKIKKTEPDPATIAGLALFLGFNSKKAFEDYERRGRFANALKRGRLRIEEAYEKKLHHQSSSGAIFALKSMGWGEKGESDSGENSAFKTIQIEIVNTVSKPVGNEKEVDL